MKFLPLLFVSCSGLTIPTFLHSSWEYGGMSEEVITSFNISSYQVVIVDETDGQYENDPVQKLPNLTTPYEDKMGNACNLIKGLLPSVECFLSLNTLETLPNSNMRQSYEIVQGLPEFENVFKWIDNQTDRGFYDLRNGIEPTRQWFVGQVTELKSNYSDHGIMLRNTLVDSEALRNVVFTRNETITFSEYAYNYFDVEYYYDTNGDQQRRVIVPSNVVEKTYELFTQYQSYLRGKIQLANRLNAVVDLQNEVDVRVESSTNNDVYISDCCDPYRLNSLLANSKRVFCRAQTCPKRCSDEATVRNYLAAYLIGRGTNHNQTFFACHHNTALNKDIGDVRDAIPTPLVYNEVNFTRQVIQNMTSMTTGEVEDFILSDTMEVQQGVLNQTKNLTLYRRIVDEGGQFQGVVLWDTPNNNGTICLVGQENPYEQCVDLLLMFATTSSPTLPDVGNTIGGSTSNGASGVVSFPFFLYLMRLFFLR